jgi:hypothetical protein
VRDLAVWVFETELSHHVMAHASHDAWSQGFASMLASRVEKVLRGSVHTSLVRFAVSPPRRHVQ